MCIQITQVSYCGKKVAKRTIVAHRGHLTVPEDNVYM